MGCTVKKAENSGGKENAPMNPRRKLVRKAVIDGATALFVAKGYSGTTTQNIADAVGLQRTSLYYYFKSKEEILAAMIDDVTISAAKRNEAIRFQKDSSVLQRIAVLVEDSVLRILEHPQVVKVLDRTEGELPSDLIENYVDAKRGVRDQVIALLSEGIDSGEIADVDVRVAAFALIGMANWTAWWYSPGKGLAPEVIARTISTLAVKALAAPKNKTNSADLIYGIRESIDALEKQIKSTDRRGLEGSGSRREGGK